MKIALANVRYSPNLGDGLIAECLEAALAACIPEAEFSSVDLAGRTDYPQDGGKGRGLALSILSKLPAPARRAVVSARLKTLAETSYGSVWREALAGCDALILGGGQLMADADLNFPVKIRSVAALAARERPISAIFGVGVSGRWSAEGARLFHEAIALLSPVHVAVRDAASAANWSAHFTGSAWPSAALCRDPGLLAGTVYPPAPRLARTRPLIGLGIVHPQTLILHSDGPPINKSHVAAQWIGIAQALMDRGFDVVLFTTGPADDEAFLGALLKAAPAHTAGRLSQMPRPRRPRDLVANISSCDAIVAHRLHANIVAYACSVAHVGFGWDAKLPAFFRSVGREEFTFPDMLQAATHDVASQVEAAITQPVSASDRQQVVDETWSAIRACAEAIKDQVSGRA